MQAYFHLVILIILIWSFQFKNEAKFETVISKLETLQQCETRCLR